MTRAGSREQKSNWQKFIESSRGWREGREEGREEARQEAQRRALEDIRSSIRALLARRFNARRRAWLTALDRLDDSKTLLSIHAAVAAAEDLAEARAAVERETNEIDES